MFGAAQSTVNTVVNTLKKPFAPFLEQSGTDMVRERAWAAVNNAPSLLPVPSCCSSPGLAYSAR
jgi:hypothetical protein